MVKTLRSSILAGIYIGIASLMYIKVGGVVGACLFSFGLVAVVCSQAKLYTGMAGFIKTKEDAYELPLILLGNVIGCGVIAFISLTSLPGISDSAISVVEARLEKTWWQAFLLSVGCGILMSTSVQNLKPWILNKNWLPLLFAVPIFILVGFLHSVADFFYYTCGKFWMMENWPKVLEIWISVVFGNFVGCNFPRPLNAKPI